MKELNRINSAKWVSQQLCCDMFGLTTAKLYHYRAEGLFIEGIHYARNPANRIAYCVAAIEKWMSGH